MSNHKTSIERWKSFAEQDIINLRIDIDTLENLRGSSELIWQPDAIP